MKILNTIENFSEEAKDKLKKPVEVSYKTLSQFELENQDLDFDGFVVGLGLNINKQAIDNAKNLKFIATATTGLDHIDVTYAKEKGIKVISLKDDIKFLKQITGTAELSWGLLIALLRKIPSAFEDIKAGNWRRENFRGSALYGKTLGIIGLGRLGKMVAAYGQTFGMKVIFADPNVSKFKHAEKVTFKKLLKDSDAVSIHVHLSAETLNLISTKELSQMKKTAVLVNTSRGKIVDEKAVLQALQEKKIAGYATDVLADENDFTTDVSQNNPLVSFSKGSDRLVIVPHIGGMTHESRVLTDLRIVEKLREFSKHK